MPEKTRVLYVDDEEINLFLFKRNFSEDFHVQTAESGSDGLKVLKEDQSIDVILSDMRMPKMDGVDFIVQARELQPTKKYAIVSGYQKSGKISEALQTGIISRFLQKPYDSEALIAMVRELSGSN